MDGSELKEIREKISCPQLGDNHYDEWGILTVQQRLTIKRMLDHIDAQENRVRSLKAEAYKEFAERLDNETFGVYYASSLYHVVDIDDVKEILKELVGDI